MDNPKSKQWADHYKNMVSWVNWQIEDMTDEEFTQRMAPNMNHGVWLLGHLAISDDDLPLYLGKGEKKYPELFEVFGMNSPCLEPSTYPPVSKLREMWKAVSDRNYQILSELPDEELSQMHARCKDIEKDYFKTKERVISFWILHQQYHAGQLGFLQARAAKARPPKPETKE